MNGEYLSEMDGSGNLTEIGTNEEDSVYVEDKLKRYENITLKCEEVSTDSWDLLERGRWYPLREKWWWLEL